MVETLEISYCTYINNGITQGCIKLIPIVSKKKTYLILQNWMD